MRACQGQFLGFLVVRGKDMGTVYAIREHCWDGKFWWK